MSKRPVSVNPDSLNIGTTQGSEYMYADTLQEYVGDYHIYPNGAVYSDAEYNVRTSKELIKYLQPLENPICQTYLKLSRKLFTDYKLPEVYFKTITPQDYQTGLVERYIVQKRNEPHRIQEVDIETFNSLNRFNLGGLNEYVWRRDTIFWRISGTPEYVRDWNLKAIAELERTIPDAGRYLLTDPTEFMKETFDEPINNRYTPGGQFKTKDGNNFVGLYHVREDKMAYQGPIEIAGIDRKLFPV
jgi:hypothetical protein